MFEPCPMIQNGLKKLDTKKRKAFWRLGHSRAAAGYGLALLMVFLASTVLIGTSVQLMLGSSSGTYLGSSTQDNLSANSVAQTGMETVLADIQSDLDSGTPVTTSYSYSSANISMPTDSASLGGGTSVVGSFSGQVTSVLGNTYTVQVTATVNSATITLTKTLALVRNSKSLDVMTNANAAYSVRKIRSAYTGSAVRVRRSSDNAEQDIGFDVNGNLDVASLNTFLSANTLPLDSVGSAAVAFGLRKLRAAYTGYAIKVRRSSDSTTQDIGFTTGGDLDIASLLNFVGSGTAYVTTWYDQSGNAKNATQATTSYQPTIVTSGVVNRLNNRPIITFDGVDDTLSFSNTLYNDITILGVYNTITGYGSPGTIAFNENNLISADAFGTGSDYLISVDTSGNVSAMVGNPDINSGNYALSPGTPGDKKLHWFSFSRTKSTAFYKVYTENGSYSDTNGNTASLNGGSQISISYSCGAGCGNGKNSFSEVLGYSSVLSESNRQLLQHNESWYYNMAPVYKDLVTGAPAILSAQASPTSIYSLRKLGAVTKAIQVRRSSDNATQDIGFDTLGNLDVGAIASFVGSNSGYVSIWYDQSGAGRNYSQAVTARQPRIMLSGILETLNGKPAIFFNNYQNALEGSGITSIGAYSAIIMAKQANAANDFFVLGGNAVNTQLICLKSNATRVSFYTANGSAGDSFSSASYTNDFTQALIPVAVTRNGSGSLNAYVNGTLEPMSPTNLPGSVEFFRIGGLGGVTWSDGWLTEVLFYNGTALTASSVNNIMQNMNSYYVPVSPTAYIVKWYDQSGNGNHLIQYNTNMQPTLIVPRVGNVNTWPTIAFNGGQYLLSSTGMPTSASYSKVAVFSMNSNGMPNNIISGNLSPNGHAFWMGNSNYLRMYHNAADFATSSLAMISDTNYAIAATYSQSSPSKTGTVYRGNVSAGTGTTASNNTDPSISVGAYDHGQYQLDGSISEAAVFSRVLSTTDRTALYNDERGYFGAQ
jgi:hypothetical protein